MINYHYVNRKLLIQEAKLINYKHKIKNWHKKYNILRMNLKYIQMLNQLLLIMNKL